MITLFQKQKGFTLVEMLISLFIFSLIMLAVSQVFSKAFLGYRSTVRVQHDIENAQYGISILAKELRTSSIVAPLGGPYPNTSSFIQFFDHSQNKCFRYRIQANALQVASAPSSGVATGGSPCDSMSLGSFTIISTGVITGSFRITPSGTIGGPAVRVGRVTIAMEVSEDASHKANIQTSISLRDFGNIGL